MISDDYYNVLKETIHLKEVAIFPDLVKKLNHAEQIDCLLKAATRNDVELFEALILNGVKILDKTGETYLLIVRVAQDDIQDRLAGYIQNAEIESFEILMRDLDAIETWQDKLAFIRRPDDQQMTLLHHAALCQRFDLLFGTLTRPGLKDQDTTEQITLADLIDSEDIYGASPLTYLVIKDNLADLLETKFWHDREGELDQLKTRLGPTVQLKYQTLFDEFKQHLEHYRAHQKEKEEEKSRKQIGDWPEDENQFDDDEPPF